LLTSVGVFLTLTFLVLPGILSAQDGGTASDNQALGEDRSLESDILDRVRDGVTVTYADASRAALAAAGRLDLATLSAAESRSRAEEELPLRGTRRDEAVTASEFAFFVVEAFDVPTGLMYRLFPSPRYALRELRFRDLMPTELESQELIDGRSALSVLSRTRAWVRERTRSAGGNAEGGGI
jgi:hypothetical protein